MADTFNKKEREKKKRQRKKAKEFKRDARKDTTSVDYDDMIAYVDENGVLQDTPPDPSTKKEVKAKQIEIGIPRRENEETDFVLRGVINFFDDTKGYGFIKTENDENFFVHMNNVAGTPAKGQKVRFEKERGAKGWAAVRVVIESE